MKGKDLARKLIVQAPPDLLVDIYGKTRWVMEGGDRERVRRLIVDRARVLGIFSAEEGESFLKFVADHFPGGCGRREFSTGLKYRDFRNLTSDRTTTESGGARWISGQDY